MVVGYINSMLVDKETFNAILNGDFIDMNISSDSIIQACIPNIYKMYFCSIAIDKTIENTKILFLNFFIMVFLKIINFSKGWVFYRRNSS